MTKKDQNLKNYVSLWKNTDFRHFPGFSNTHNFAQEIQILTILISLN